MSESAPGKEKAVVLDSPLEKTTPVSGEERRSPTLGTRLLSRNGATGRGCGKAILLGEHSVVYGKPAIASALPDLELTLHILPLAESREPESWLDAWELIRECGERVLLDDEQRQLLTRSLNLALADAGVPYPLSSYRPQPLQIHMNFPLGAGLGGSAALCAAMVEFADELVLQGEELGVRRPLRISDSERSGSALRKVGEGFDSDTHSRAVRATMLDSVFHGVASGVDTATVVSRGLIACGLDSGMKRLANRTPFFLLLADSGQRADTSHMVQALKLQRLERPCHVDEVLNRLGELAHQAISSLQFGRLKDLGAAMDEAHGHLAHLELSTRELDHLVQIMRAEGALGAKLTGSGGGGFAIGLFESYPEQVIPKLKAMGAVYVSEVHPTEVRETPG